LATNILRFLPKAIRDRVVRSRMRVDEAALARLELSIADGQHDLESASRLLHDAYVGRGIATPHPSGLRITPHFVLPSTVTLVAKRAGAVVGTLSLLPDGPLGPPMAQIFGPEIARLRAQGRHCVELGALAVTRDQRGTGLAALLYRMAFEVSRSCLSVDDFVFAVHPDAEQVYESIFLAERIGQIRGYPGLNASALAIPIRVDVRRAPSRMRRAFGHLPRDPQNPHHFYFERPYPQMQLPSCDRPLERHRVRRSRAVARILARHPDALDALDAATLSALRAELPKFDFQPWQLDQTFGEYRAAVGQ
jgi:GNAT superfamily N-acetyltransferase